MILHRATQRAIPAYAVAVPPAHPLALQVLLGLELLEDPLDCAFGDADPNRDVPHPGLGVFPHAQQHVGVIRQEVPGRHGFRDLTGRARKVKQQET